MGFLQPLTKDIGHFKGGFYGDTGSGKTTTAALIAIGLYRHRKMTGPIAFYDSERGSGFVSDLFKQAKIEIVGVQSRSFKDLVTFMIEAEKAGIGIGIIDSITHPWRELLTAYKEQVRRNKLTVADWGPIKDQWHRGYSMRYVNAKMNVIMCGRQQNIFEDIPDDDNQDGKKKWNPVKVGTRMATEGETGYEPNLLVEMERRMLRDGGSYARVACVLKDRSFRLDGLEREFTMPFTKTGPDLEKLVEENQPFQFVKPHIESLDPTAGASSSGIRTESSAAFFNQEGQTDMMRDAQEKELLLGNVEQLLSKYFPSRDKLSTKAKADIIEGATWSMNKRTRNWDVVTKKFSLQDVKCFYSIVDILVAPEKRKILNEALALGVNSKGEITNADAAAEAVKKASEALLSGAATTSDLPF